MAETVRRKQMTQSLTTTSDLGTTSTSEQISREGTSSGASETLERGYEDSSAFDEQEVPITIPKLNGPDAQEDLSRFDQQNQQEDVLFDQQYQLVNYQYNAHSINIINAGSFHDLGSDAEVMLNGFVNELS